MSAYEVKTHPAFSGYDLPESTSLINRVRRLFVNLVVRSEEKRAYYEAVSELEALSDRDLDDIGVARDNIPEIARNTVKSRYANG